MVKSDEIDKSFVMKIVSKRLCEIRIDFNLTQQEMAELLNVDQSTIASIETGRREIRIKQLYILAVQLKVNLNYLLGLSNNKLDANTHKNHLRNIGKQTIIK